MIAKFNYSSDADNLVYLSRHGTRFAQSMLQMQILLNLTQQQVDMLNAVEVGEKITIFCDVYDGRDFHFVRAA